VFINKNDMVVDFYTIALIIVQDTMMTA